MATTEEDYLEVKRMIEDSILYDKIVTIDYVDSVAYLLRNMAEDWVDTPYTVEYWGEDDGEDWRIHLRRTKEDLRNG